MFIYNYTAGDWNYLGMWDYSGNPYIGYGAIPPSRYVISENDSPIYVQWDQIIIEDSSTVNPDESINLVQADSGKYKIEIAYGNFSDCSKTITSEFIIE